MQCISHTITSPGIKLANKKLSTSTSGPDGFISVFYQIPKNECIPIHCKFFEKYTSRQGRGHIPAYLIKLKMPEYQKNHSSAVPMNREAKILNGSLAT